MIKSIITDRAVLSLTCHPVELPIGTGDKINIHNLLDTANDMFERCAGLAAPQIGCLRRLITVKLGGQFVVMINPEIISHKGKHQLGLESCLSRPVTLTSPVRVKRWYKVKVRWTDIDGNLQSKIFKSLEARVVQHEIDHLDGKVIGYYKP